MRSWKLNFAINFIWWFAVVSIWMSFVDTDFIHEHEFLGEEHVHSFHLSFSFFVTTFMAVLNTIAQWLWARSGFRYRISFRKKLFYLFLQQLVFALIASVLLYVFLRFAIKFPVSEDFGMFAERFNIRQFWFFSVIAAYVLEIVRAVDQKLGPGNLWKIFIGAFSQPKEMERIFMFLDLRDSTSIAEELGNIKYSQFLQDCFHDISVVQRYGAEVFQYVGDEVVLVWKPKNGLKNANCIAAYFAFMEAIELKRHYYKTNYDTVPFFKAGVHIGQVVLAEVGEIKREIAYHGDTINTASRIQEQCNIFDQSIIVSRALIDAVEAPDNSYAITELGLVQLKGKDISVDILGIGQTK